MGFSAAGRRLGSSATGRFALLAGCLALLLAVLAAPASAEIMRLKSGAMIGFQPLGGSANPAQPQMFDAVFHNLDYSGGPVMASNTNYVIEWQPSNYTGTAYQSSSFNGKTYSTDYLGGIEQYFTDLAHDSGSNTNSDAVSAQYNDKYGHTAAYNSSYAGEFTDTDPLPANSCTDGTYCISDAQLQAELISFVQANHLPETLTTEYFVLTPPGVISCLDAGVCSGNDPINPYFCAYHSAADSGNLIYSNIPDMTGINGCDPIVTDCPSATGCDYPNGPADGVLSAVSHEHNESITDPHPDDAWTDWQSGCTGTDITCGGEIGDKCNGGEASDPNTVVEPTTNVVYNQVINGHDYFLQPEWSNRSGSAGHCLDSYPSTGDMASSSFLVASESGDTVNFDASASTATNGVAEYVWQFNDSCSSSCTQNYDVETTSPTISHTFPATGTYQVALTVMAQDGSSQGFELDVPVGSGVAPTSSSPPTISGIAQQGQILTESHGSWTGSPDSYRYQWEDCDSSGSNCIPVTGATGQTYTLGSNDVGHTIVVQETAHNGAGYSAPAVSSPTAVVLPLAPVNSSPPTITGTAQQGQTLAEAHGGWSGSPTSYAYQWEDCNTSGAGCAAIAGATAQTYALTAADVGHTIVVQETARNAGGDSAAANSVATAVVTPTSSVTGGTSGTSSTGGTSSTSGTGGTSSTSSTGGTSSTSSTGGNAARPGFGSAKVSRSTVVVRLTCSGATSSACSVSMVLIATETLRGKKILAVTAAKTHKRVVLLGLAKVTLHGGQAGAFHVSLNRAGKRLLAQRRMLRVHLIVASGQLARTYTIVFHAKKSKKHARATRALVARVQAGTAG